MKKTFLLLLCIALSLSTTTLTSCDSDDADDFAILAFLVYGTGEWQVTAAKTTEDGEYTAWADWLDNNVPDTKIRENAYDSRFLFKAIKQVTVSGYFQPYIVDNPVFDFTISDNAVHVSYNEGEVYDIRIANPELVNGRAEFIITDQKGTTWVKVQRIMNTEQ